MCANVKKLLVKDIREALRARVGQLVVLILTPPTTVVIGTITEVTQGTVTLNVALVGAVTFSLCNVTGFLPLTTVTGTTTGNGTGTAIATATSTSGLGSGQVDVLLARLSGSIF